MAGKKKAKRRTGSRRRKKGRGGRKKRLFPLAIAGGGLVGVARLGGYSSVGGSVAPHNVLDNFKVSGNMGISAAAGNLGWGTSVEGGLALILPLVGGVIVSKMADATGLNRHIARLTRGKAKL